jgi:hypothetical protein
MLENRKKCLRTVKFHIDYCSWKGVPIRRAKWNWYILCIDKRWKLYLKINLLDKWAVCFLKGKPPEFVRFFNEIIIFAILCQLHYLLVEYKTVFRSSWVHFGFSYVSVIWMSWLGYLNELIDFWRPDDGRNRTCYFGLGMVNFFYRVIHLEKVFSFLSQTFVWMHV